MILQNELPMNKTELLQQFISGKISRSELKAAIYKEKTLICEYDTSGAAILTIDGKEIKSTIDHARKMAPMFGTAIFIESKDGIEYLMKSI